MRGSTYRACPPLGLLTQSVTTCLSPSSLSLVPGGSDGPSGVLICSENYITYKNFGDQPDIRCPIPRRRVSLNAEAWDLKALVFNRPSPRRTTWTTQSEA